MWLSSIILHQFKNHPHLKLTFSDNLNLITGPNGTGKTNILDAIYFLSNTKSAFSSTDSLAIQHGHNFLRIEGLFQDVKTLKVECIVEQKNGKTFLVDGKAPTKYSEFIGRFPIVFVTPYDTDLIREGSEIRRKFFDQILSHSNPVYLDNLLSYNKLLKQRNALLKQFSDSGKSNFSLLEVYDQQIIPLNIYIASQRKIFIEELIPIISKSYEKLAHTENINITYRSECLEPNFGIHFKRTQGIDVTAQRTTLGIHTDDFEFIFNNSSLKKYGSQGQQKTYVLALKLAHFEFISLKKQKKPILLLDDIFDRLDEERVTNLTKLIEEKSFGQVFITDATPKRLLSIFKTDPEKMAIFRTEV